MQAPPYPRWAVPIDAACMFLRCLTSDHHPPAQDQSLPAACRHAAGKLSSGMDRAKAGAQNRFLHCIPGKR
jgi:hypothetical protein